MFPPGRLYFVENTEKINKIYLGNHLALSRTNRGIKIANSKWEVICRFDIKVHDSMRNYYQGNKTIHTYFKVIKQILIGES